MERFHGVWSQHLTNKKWQLLELYIIFLNMSQWKGFMVFGLNIYQKICRCSTKFLYIFLGVCCRSTVQDETLVTKIDFDQKSNTRCKYTWNPAMTPIVEGQPTDQNNLTLENSNRNQGHHLGSRVVHIVYVCMYTCIL